MREYDIEKGGNEMKKVLIATHGKMASGMSRTIQLLVGNMAEITTIDAYVEPDDDIETQMSQFFEQAGEEKIFVFTDIQGGSVNQKLLKYSERKNVVLITGVNIPILIHLMFADDDVTVDELQKMIEEARQELKLVSADGCLVEENKLKKSTQEKKQVEQQPEQTTNLPNYNVMPNLFHKNKYRTRRSSNYYYFFLPDNI